MATYWEKYIAAHSADEMFSWYKYLLVSFVFYRLGFLEWESFSFLIAPFPDLCLLVPFSFTPSVFGNFVTYANLAMICI